MPRSRSDHHGQFGERVRQASPGWHFGPEVVEAPAKVLDQGVRSDDDPGGVVPLQPSHRSEACLKTSVVGLDGVVGVNLRVMERCRQQLVDDAGVDPVPVGGDLHRRDPGPVDRSGEEPPGRPLCSAVARGPRR
jgi:hypothetical protein